jgi:hypothetical protein
MPYIILSLTNRVHCGEHERITHQVVQFGPGRQLVLHDSILELLQVAQLLPELCGMDRYLLSVQADPKHTALHNVLQIKNTLSSMILYIMA